jgi:glycerol-3-phosphate acyltransferase PlsY
VTYILTGHSASKLGTSGNPGMANVMSNLGIIPGIIVLIGDILKCVIAMIIGYYLIDASKTGILIGGTACTVGHDFPFWRKFKGGKGVATTCSLIFIYNPFVGFISLIVGLIVAIATKYLCVGAVVIPLILVPFAFKNNVIDGLVMTGLTLLMFYKHYPQISLIKTHEAEKNDIIAGLKNKLGHK